MAPAEVCHTPNISTSRRMKSQEEKTAYDLACDYIYFNKLGKEAYRANTKVAATLRKIGREVETRHEALLKNMCNKLDIRASTAEITFRTVADEIFSTGINWGRIVVLYCFAAEVAGFCSRNEIDIVEDVVRWLSEYVSERTITEWIRKAGGWDEFCEQFKDIRDEREKFWWNSILYTTLGLGTLAAMLYAKS
ncbi:hypothetical protein OS493_035487 [Desmophyllum pertusum]|uniref:Bcl-2 Bcl-2 homology region 1-3 domain-containing protein n=1 Tax=Desmophyllum pertusum TaxID=174260 RepID=A0A9X0CQL4_9CNID|nr:hypothetical protein OS493_035487 [Desmophyllum pertusum]